ncbi:MAG: hypothetical protein PHF84_06990 [bacterium]|nr:hypothetical protein [bacterium]
MANKISEKSIGFFLQARLNSTRLPEKLFLTLKDKSILIHILERLRTLRGWYDYLVVLVPSQEFERIQNHIQVFPDIIVFAGDPDNVLKRFYDANKKLNVDVIVRLTGDNPLVDVLHLKKALTAHLKAQVDYTAYTNLPLGAGFEILNREVLNMVYNGAREPHQLEHVTPYIREHKDIFKVQELKASGIYNMPGLRLTIDEESDYVLMQVIFDNLYKGEPIPLKQVIKFLQQYPEYAKINEGVRQKGLKE